MAGSDFEGTSPKLFWPETLIYSLPGAELNQMLTLVVAIKSEMPCEPELLLFAGMNDHLHATGFLEQLKGDEPAPKKIWEAIQTLFAAMNEVQENVASRFGSKSKVVFTTFPGYASMPPALQFVYAILILIAEGNGWRILMAAPNRELEPTNLRLRKSELAAAWAHVSHALRGFYELADILIVLDEVLLLEISNFARQLKLSPVIGDDHPVVTHLTASLWFRSMELTITSSTSKSRGPSIERKIFGAFIQEILNMPISLLLALYLVYPRYLFDMGPAYMFSRGEDTPRIDGYLALVLLTHGELVSFHRLMKYGEPLSMGRTHSSVDTYSYKCAAGLKTLLVQYLLMQNRYLTGEEKSPKTRDEWKKVNGGMPLLTDLCLAIRSDPMGMIRGLEEVITCIYGPAVTYAFPDPLVTAYRYSVTHLSLISILDGTTLNWCQQEVLRAQMSNTVLFGKVKDPELVIYSFRGQLQCRMGGKIEGPYPKFWNLNPLTANGQEILRIPAWKKSFELVKRELEAILEKQVLPASIPEFPTVSRMTLGMNSSLVVPSLFARAATEEQQREFIDGWDPLFIGYTAAIYFHTSDARINSWTTQANKMRGSMPPKFEVRDALRTLERAGLENKLPVWDDDRMIVKEGHIAQEGDEMVFATRRYRAPYGLEQVEMRQEGKELDAAGPLYVALT